MLHELGDQRVSALHGLSRRVDEVRLHVAPPLAEMAGVTGREECTVTIRFRPRYLRRSVGVPRGGLEPGCGILGVADLSGLLRAKLLFRAWFPILRLHTVVPTTGDVGSGHVLAHRARSIFSTMDS